MTPAPELNRLEYAVFREQWARAFLIRSFEQRLLKLFSEGKLFGTVHTCIGQEFSGVAVASHLRDGDLIFSNHRCHGHYLARTGDVDGLMAEIMGRETGICGGRGGSQHICSAGVYSNGVQGGIVPVAAGLALAQSLRQSGNIVVCFIGDGTLGEGAVYEALNIASKWNLPLMIVLENNGYSQSTVQNQTLAGDIAARAAAFGIKTWESNTWSPGELTELVGKAVSDVRTHSRPSFIRIDTYRLMAHSKGDDDRDAKEIERFWGIDPISGLTEQDPDIAEGLRGDAESQVDRAVDLALRANFSSAMPAEQPSPRPIKWEKTVIEGKERIVSRINLALREALTRDDRVFLLGEDIESPYGGAFKVTRELSHLFPKRVRNTPISEGAIVGVANGLALAGMRPVCEIMFGDFLTLAADQIINHAAKFQWMYNDQVSVPVIIRTPMGGRRGYGATHSQCLEKHFLGLPGTQVLALHGRYDPYLIYDTLLRTADRPTLVIENKILYGEFAGHKTTEGFWCEHSDETFPTTKICSAATPDVTIVCYGGCLPEAEKAIDHLFEEHDIVAEIICPVQIYPLLLDPITDSVKRSGRLLVVEEGQSFCGFGAEVLASVYQACSGQPLVSRRIGAAPHPLPACKPAEATCLPGVETIVASCVDLVRNV